MSTSNAAPPTAETGGLGPCPRCSRVALRRCRWESRVEVYCQRCAYILGEPVTLFYDERRTEKRHAR